MKTVEYWLARFVLATLSSTSLSTANALARGYVRLLDMALPRLRRTALKNLEMAGFAGRERITTGVFNSVGRLVVSFARFPQITRENVAEWIRYQGLENFKQAQARGKGVLVATGHFGNWELSAFAHAYLVAPMHIVVRPSIIPASMRWWNRGASFRATVPSRRRMRRAVSCGRWRRARR